ALSVRGLEAVVLAAAVRRRRRRTDSAVFPPLVSLSTSSWASERGTAFFSWLPDIHLLQPSVFYAHIYITVGFLCGCCKDCKIGTGVVMVVLELPPSAVNPSVDVRLLLVRPERVYLFSPDPCHWCVTSTFVCLGFHVAM